LHQSRRNEDLRSESCQPPVLQPKQDGTSEEVAIRQWLDGVWNQTFMTRAQAILNTMLFEFSAAGLSDLDIE
jgi:hypothetical protein